ncbi:MAG: Lon protease family protein, partial [Thermoleophilaceae bacterium]
ALADDMVTLVKEAKERIPRAFESDDYRVRRHELAEELEHERDEGLQRLRARAAELEVGLNVSPVGITTFPLIEGQPATAEQFAALPPDDQERLRKRGEEIGRQVEEFVRHVHDAERAAAQRVRELDHGVAGFAIGQLMSDLEARYDDVPEVAKWLREVREDTVGQLDQFRSEGQPAMPAPLGDLFGGGRGDGLVRYVVNVLVSHEAGSGAPVVFETNPTYHRLFGRIDYRSMMGAVSTDHMQIRSGAMHRANGGYLVLQAADVLVQPFVWQKLKDVLRNGRLPLENIGSELTLFPTSTIAPQPIGLDVKVVLVGPGRLYALLHELDEDFGKLFKVKADFDVEIPWDGPDAPGYAAFISRQVREDGLRHFDPSGVARIVEQGAREAGDQRKLSSRFMTIADLVVEASHWAAEAGSELVGAEHVQHALDERVFRSNLFEEKLREAATDGTLLIDVEGEAIGQVNGLAVSAVGDYVFGHPVRITATTAAGEGEMLDIDRETKMSGPLHDKGFLILSGYLHSRFGRERPLSLAASIVFEQSYAPVEGDSASSGELYVLLSSLAGAPVRQGIAVTGSVNQHGQLQAIGGVNEKIEGFFRLCSEKGLTGPQGVLIPEANVVHLMLSEDVLEAIRAGRFQVWAARTVDEGIELLTGIPAGERTAEGTYPPSSVNGSIDARLRKFAETVRAHHGNGRAPLPA